MSHIVTVQARIKDTAALALACRRLGSEQPIQGRTRLFSQEVEGLLVRLPKWRYPVVVDVAQGDLHYDNFEGRWGDLVHLNRLMQMYSVEKTKLEVHKKGWMVQETSLQNGSIQLQITQLA